MEIMQGNNIHEEEDFTILDGANGEAMESTANVESSSLGSLDERLPGIAPTSRAIDELQSAFGSILLARRSVDPVTDYSNFSWIHDYRLQKAKTKKPAIVPKWTGSFALFAFPRELRDMIYYHYLYRPKGVLHHRRTAHTSHSDEHTEEFTSLFLTSRCIYHEAFQVFSHYNLVEIECRNFWSHHRLVHKRIEGTLRLFPDKPARSLQRLGVSSSQYMIFNSSRYRLTANDMFVQMLRDAYIFQDTFPKMREFAITFRGYDDFFGDSTMLQIDGQSEEEQVAKCLDIMERWLGDDQIVPPRCFKFQFDENWQFQFLRLQEDIWNEAYARLVEDREKKVESLEESGKKWIEEAWEDEGKKPKKAGSANWYP